MNGLSPDGAAKYQAARPVLVIRIFFDDSSAQECFGSFFFPDVSFNASLNSMLPPKVGSIANAILDKRDVHRTSLEFF